LKIISPKLGIFPEAESRGGLGIFPEAESRGEYSKLRGKKTYEAKNCDLNLSVEWFQLLFRKIKLTV